MSESGPQPRVFHLDDGRLWRGGQHQVWLLMRELAALGIEQRLIAREGCPLTARARQIGVEVLPMRIRGELDLLGPLRVAAWARRFDANILHAHTGHAHTIGLRCAARLKGSAQLVTTRRVDFAVGRGFFSGRKYRHPNQHFIAISEGVRQVLIEGGVPAQRIDLVHSGVPELDPAEILTREQVRAELKIDPQELAIVNVGALTDHKGQRWLIEAFAQVAQTQPQARLHILGEGELREELSAQIKQLGLTDKVILHGFVQGARNKLGGFDLFVTSSHLEGLGTVNLDAMLAGVPVVATAAGGIPEVVIDGQTGRLVPPRDAQALAQAMLAALQDPEENARLCEQARRHAQEHFSAQAMARGTLTVYHKLLLQKD